MRSVLVVFALVWFAHDADAAPVDYERDVQPILAGTCYKCHGPDKQESDLRLDSPKAILKGGKLGPAIVAGKSKESVLIQAITGSSDDIVAMPPEDGPLSDAAIKLLTRWVDEGAKFEQQKKRR
jgi:hypothetical protein